MMETIDQSSGLPDHWCRPQRDPKAYQQSLFARSAVQALMEHGISPDDVADWHRRGWLSGNPEEILTATSDSPWMDELLFVREVARSGMPLAAIDRLLAHSTRYACPDPRYAFFSFRHGWAEAPPPPAHVLQVDEVVEWIADAERDDLDWLKKHLTIRLRELAKADKPVPAKKDRS